MNTNNYLGNPKIQINKDSLKSNILNILESNQYIVVASGINGKIAARTVDYINDDLDIVFFTWNYTNKYAEIIHNKLIALCINNLQIEGNASIITDSKAKEYFHEKYKTKLPDLYSKFISLPNTELILVKPVLMTVMSYESQSLFLDSLDLIDNNAYRAKLSDW